MKTKALIATFGMLMSLASMSSAQQFTILPDTPENHWVYEYIQKIKNSVLYEYSIGLNGRFLPMSRNEIGIAICQLWELLRGRETAKQVNAGDVRNALCSSQIKTIKDETAQIANLKELVDVLQNFRSNTPLLFKLYQSFEQEVNNASMSRDDCRNIGLELRIRNLEMTTVRYDWDTNLNLVDPTDLKPENCSREDRWKFNGLLTTAGKPVAELKKGWAGDTKLTSRLEYALATYLLHKELRGKYRKPSLAAMTSLTTEFRRELVYYFGIDMYQLKSELK